MVAYGEMLDKFRSHARVLARLRDLPTMIPLYDIFEENGTAYTVSEKVGGVTLAARLRQSGGRMSWDEARPLFMPLFAALSAVHSAGIYHLGICPENILLGSDGRPHFQNFLVPEAHMVGTDLKPQLMAGYAAPEQYELEQRYTAATDVYGMAATIFCRADRQPAGRRRGKGAGVGGSADAGRRGERASAPCQDRAVPCPAGQSGQTDSDR